ncbi:SulP family inorganic anion transporter [Nocardioides caldifontis]|uniref:SulP family inorganic anion transporter n=1 Tax=Nocardioides caldifontis TaxID=2588938 RepID=UPI0011DF1B98|nr:SulP family inorganic anion transporter [Nocardioides caldifontis]
MSSAGRSAPSRGDLVAAVTVAMVLVPQSLAYAALAGMPPVHGLYAAAVAPVLAALVGSSPYLQTGPTALTSLLVAGSLASLPDLTAIEYVEHAALLALVVGTARLALGLLRGGIVAYLLSQPILTGFTLGASFLIAASQLPALLGADAAAPNPLEAAVRAVAAPGSWSVVAICVGVAVIACTLLSRRVSPLLPGALLASVAVLAMVHLTEVDVDVVGQLPSGLPPLTLDLPFSAVPHLLVPGVVIALIGFAEAVSISRHYASADRTRWDPDRELVGQGLANLGAGIFGGFAVGGSFSRSALNRLSGARTRWSSLFTGLVVMAVLPFASVLSQLPTAVLAALVIASVLQLLDPRPLARTWRYSRPQGLVALATLALTLAFSPSVQWGVVAGVGFALAVHLWRELRLDLDQWVEGDLLHVRPQGVLYFGSAPALETRVLEQLADHPQLMRVELHLQRLGRIDLTGALVLRDICRDLADAGVHVVISGVQPQCRRLVGSVLGEEGIDHTHGARASTRPGGLHEPGRAAAPTAGDTGRS